jgi:cytochrome c553
MKFCSTVLALCMALVATAHAEGNAQADANHGKVLAYTCHGCHGIESYKNAYPMYSVPRVGSQNANYILAALKGYASGERVHPTMTAHASSLTEAQRADIAAFFANTPVRQSGAPVGTPPTAAAVCTACHGTDGISIMNDYPILAGQHEDYLEHALRDYKSGKRKNGVMAGIIASVNEKDIPALAQFFASQKPALCSTDQIRDKGKCQ